MAACGSLQHIFENPLPENPTLLESLSPWNQLKPVKPIEQNSFTEIFGELHFKDSSSQSSSSSSPPLLQSLSSSSSSSSSSFPISLFSSSPVKDFDCNSADTPKLNNANNPHDSLFANTRKDEYSGCQKKGDGFSLMKYESLQLCTEGLGFESSDDVEDLKSDMNEEWRYQAEKLNITRQHFMSGNSVGGEFRKPSRSSSGSFPPPISSIGKSGKPWVCFKSYRQDGRFVLKQVRIPTQELLHACREDGRLKLHFVQPNDDIAEEDEDEVEQKYYAEENNEQEYEDEVEEQDEQDNKCNDDDHEIVDDG